MERVVCGGNFKQPIHYAQSQFNSALEITPGLVRWYRFGLTMLIAISAGIINANAGGVKGPQNSVVKSVVK